MSAASNGLAKAATKSPYERFDEVVRHNPLDFNSWVQLLTLVETEPSMSRENVESTYDRFLEEFPLCFGYWNKYAQYEYNLGTNTGDEEPVLELSEAIEKAKEIYERGVVAVRYSVDMWHKYVDFLVQTIRAPVDQARSVLDRALEAVGSDPMAGPLWEKYIQLETVNNDMVRLNKIFKRIMQQPLNNLEEFWEKYNHFVLAQQLHTLATSDELNAIAGEEEMDEGLLRVKLMNAVENEKNQTVEIIAKRQAFEAGIDRTYFHVTPVNNDALKNWHAYLDYEEIAGNEKRCEHLYERCLIACANYDIMWVRYALWKERVQGFEAGKEVFERAVTVFLKYRSTIFLEYALFLEANDKLDLARQQYHKIFDDLGPTLAEAYVRYCNMERRLGNYDEVKKWYLKGIETIKKDSNNIDGEAYAYLTIWYANFVAHELHDFASAQKIFVAATSEVTKSLMLWLNYIHFELSIGTFINKDEMRAIVERIDQIYTSALRESCELSSNQKNDLWYHYIEFLENHGASAHQIRAALEKEVTWKRKYGMPRIRRVKMLRVDDESYVDAYESVDVGSKRARVDTTQVAVTEMVTPAIASAAAIPTANGLAATGAPYAPYYQQYQGYGGATAGYSQAAYGQYGSYYPQQ